MPRQFDSWGRLDRHERQSATIESLDPAADDGSVLAFGNGRSYGDSCHNDDGRLIPMRPGARIHAFDPGSGILEADAGVTLQEILEHVIPHGFYLEVTPGTALATLGGAVANDVHGKNHHRRGSFGHSVISFDLLRSDGPALRCSRQENREFFSASIGGMGLTGVMTRIRIRLMKVASPDIRQLACRFDNIDGYFDRIDAIDREHEYSVAWIDQLATGKSTGRGVLMAGNHAEAGDRVSASRRHLSVPFQPPVNLLNRLTLKAFNALYYGRAPQQETRSLVGWRGYFHPLDAIGEWNRLYGPKGLYQHQSVFPADKARETVLELMECARRHGHASFLTVLKRFGALPQPGLLSFARPGFTLTLDFANQGAATLEMLAALDEIVLAAGGALNPYKDARMSAQMFEASFPDWRRLEELRDPKIVSDFWKRTALALPADRVDAGAPAGRKDGVETCQNENADNLKQINLP
ncbi:FAD-binding oxidoreductase [Pseudohoeflea suaedae]|uniref:FAD-binding oxidoreductase n=1 Tax=Pseudohoeflea suaedae TaxID=877384 RepID=A0A4V3A7L8_9HYPH|nr:FAD-binding oxidoreductase [Pseudohoeflea suaedae]TDH39265.1 FAD-binding oxidoreductase [Pseudohoeflea suaedae]